MDIKSTTSLNEPEELFTYPRFILMQQAKVQASGDLTILLTAIHAALKDISRSVKQTIFESAASGKNVGLESRLRKYATEALVSNIKQTHTAAVIASINMTEAYLADLEEAAKYVVVLNPLVGVENIDNTAPMGTIFGVYKRTGITLTWRQALQSGKNILAAGYCLYDHITTFILKVKSTNGVKEFIFDEVLGEFILWSNDLRIPKKGHVYSINEGQVQVWNPALYEFVRRKKDNRLGRNSTTFYTGCPLADIHYIIKVGGICVSPKTCRMNDDQLNLVFFVNPMSYIVMAAGGLALSGITSVLFIEPEEFHQIVPFTAGSPEDVIDYAETIISEMARENKN